VRLHCLVTVRKWKFVSEFFFFFCEFCVMGCAWILIDVFQEQ
jgi:hypothetical protein